MNPLQRSLIEKYGNDNGFEHVLSSDAQGVLLASARHPTRVLVSSENGDYQVCFQVTPTTLLPELQRDFPQKSAESGRFSLDSDVALAALLRRAASLSRALPNQAVTDYEQAVADELKGITNTEVKRLVSQRVGQEKFRNALLVYWNNACAVTGFDTPDVLRASHAKPWADASDAERLDVFNGFLLNANLDALFDRFLISFDEQGVLVISPALAGVDLQPLGVVSGMKLRWIEASHQPYLEFHRARLRK